jgi:hypothetical protein
MFLSSLGKGRDFFCVPPRLASLIPPGQVCGALSKNKNVLNLSDLTGTIIPDHLTTIRRYLEEKWHHGKTAPISGRR